MFVAILVLLCCTAAAQAERCECVSLDKVPLLARRALVDQATGDGSLEGVCFLRQDGTVAYRARGRRSGITVEVSGAGKVLRRIWSGFD